jgi:hypothetical protein
MVRLRQHRSIERQILLRRRERLAERGRIETRPITNIFPDIVQRANQFRSASDIQFNEEVVYAHGHPHIVFIRPILNGTEINNELSTRSIIANTLRRLVERVLEQDNLSRYFKINKTSN